MFAANIKLGSVSSFFRLGYAVRGPYDPSRRYYPST